MNRTAILVMLLLSVACSGENTLPSKSDCSTEVVFFLPKGFAEKDMGELSDKIHNTFIAQYSIGKLPFFGSISYPSIKNPRIYFLFKGHCNEKMNITETFLSKIKNEIPPYKINEGKVPPDVMKVQGVWWRD